MPRSHRLPDKIIDAHNHVSHKTLKELLKNMDDNLVERTLVIGTPLTSNKETLECARMHPDRFIAGAYVDPRRKARAVEEVKRWHGEGVNLIKLFPNLGYYPDDDAVLPVFEKIADLKMAVLSHCGWLSPVLGISASYYSHPGRFEKVIRRFPETVFIMAHMGGIAGFLETIMLTTRTPNTYCDCAPGQGMWVIENWPVVSMIPADRILWGADSLRHGPLIDRCHKAFNKLGFGPRLADIFYNNALGIFQRIGALPASPSRKRGANRRPGKK